MPKKLWPKQLKYQKKQSVSCKGGWIAFGVSLELSDKGFAFRPMTQRAIGCFVAFSPISLAFEADFALYLPDPEMGKNWHDANNGIKNGWASLAFSFLRATCPAFISTPDALAQG